MKQKELERTKKDHACRLTNTELNYPEGNGKPSTMAQCKTSQRTMINDKMAINAEPSLKGNRLKVTLQIKIIH